MAGRQAAGAGGGRQKRRWQVTAGRQVTQVSTRYRNRIPEMHRAGRTAETSAQKMKWQVNSLLTAGNSIASRRQVERKRKKFQNGRGRQENGNSAGISRNRNSELGTSHPEKRRQRTGREQQQNPER